jgi:hypothetical protein
MGVGHRQFFLTLHSAQPQDKAKVHKRLQQMNHIVWYMVALEPYTGRENDHGTEHKARTPYHLHVMFRVKNQISGKKLRARWVQWWSSVSRGATGQDVYERPGEGSYADNMNYITKVPQDEHKTSEQLDPEPIIWPENYVEAPGRVKVSSEDIIKEIQDGKTYEDLLRKWPSYMLNNGHKVKAFMKDYKPIVKEILSQRAHDEWLKRQEERKFQGKEEIFPNFGSGPADLGRFFQK